jgi:hypothetical protein
MLRSAKNQGVRERKSANAKARNIRPKKVRESASAKTKKSTCPALSKIHMNIADNKSDFGLWFLFLFKNKNAAERQIEFISGNKMFQY